MELELNKATIHYESFGEGRPLLALHGWMIDHRYMQKLLEPAFDNRDDWKRIYIDIPGHGRSFATGAIRNSDDISGLLLIAPDIDHGSENTELPPRTVLVKSEMAAADLQPLERRLFENELVVQSVEALEILREIVVPAFRMADSALLEKLSASYTLSIEEDMRTQLFDRPTLFLMGRQDHSTGYQNVWSIIENYPRASFAVLDRAGHTIGPIEQVNLCQSLIKDWLDRVEENQQT